MIAHEVQPGDCLSSIAHEYNYLWQTLWNHPSNSALKTERKDPNILYPGDVVNVPEDDLKHESRPVDQQHKFQLESEDCKLRVRMLRNDKPRAGEAYQLIIDDPPSNITGQTDGDGWVEQTISPGARTGTLVMTDANETFPLLLGGLDPLKTTSGIQQRLQNLGFSIGNGADGVLGPDTRNGVRAFQKKYNLKVDGDPGPVTQAKLKEIHGS